MFSLLGSAFFSDLRVAGIRFIYSLIYCVAMPNWGGSLAVPEWDTTNTSSLCVLNHFIPLSELVLHFSSKHVRKNCGRCVSREGARQSVSRPWTPSKWSIRYPWRLLKDLAIMPHRIVSYVHLIVSRKCGPAFNCEVFNCDCDCLFQAPHWFWK